MPCRKPGCGGQPSTAASPALARARSGHMPRRLSAEAVLLLLQAVQFPWRAWGCDLCASACARAELPTSRGPPCRHSRVRLEARHAITTSASCRETFPKRKLRLTLEQAARKWQRPQHLSLRQAHAQASPPGPRRCCQTTATVRTGCSAATSAQPLVPAVQQSIMGACYAWACLLQLNALPSCSNSLPVPVPVQQASGTTIKANWESKSLPASRRQAAMLKHSQSQDHQDSEKDSPSKLQTSSVHVQGARTQARAFTSSTKRGALHICKSLSLRSRHIAK